MKSLVVFFIVGVLGALMALAGSGGGAQFMGVPLFALMVALVFVIQWVSFIPAFVWQTEKFFDLTGSLTYILVTACAVVIGGAYDLRSLLLAGVVIVWAARLGSFLFGRIKQAGKDGRFDEIKPSFFRFLNVWTIQALWITVTAAAALVALTTATRKDLDVFAIVGLLVWLLGFGFEVVADTQKSRFNADPAHKGKFINVGLWARSRHPNYFGEIVLWLGVAIMAFPVLQGWQYVALISPLFVTLLLTRVSGIPLLEKRADAKWGGQPEYEEYKKKTPVLIPRL